MSGRILVIRGGAIGDFLLTLPALHLLRDNFPDCHLEILGYRHIVSLAEDRFYANSSRSIEYGPLSGFFGKNNELDEELTDYFRSFHQIISYLYDPDELFANNLRRIGIRDFLRGPGKLNDQNHATAQLAEPLQSLALFLDDPSLRFYPNSDDLAAADAILEPVQKKHLLALHPGSGGKAKVWPASNWTAVLKQLLSDFPALHVVVCGGEADEQILTHLRTQLPVSRMMFLENLHLPVLGAVLKKVGCFLGHDSGISHLAAAAGCQCLLLFGPTEPSVWAPPNDGVKIIRAPDCRMESIAVSTVLRHAEALLT